MKSFFASVELYLFRIHLSFSLTDIIISSHLISSHLTNIPIVAKNTTRKDTESQKRKEHLKDLPLEISRERVIMLKGTYIRPITTTKKKKSS